MAHLAWDMVQNIVTAFHWQKKNIGGRLKFQRILIDEMEWKWNIFKCQWHITFLLEKISYSWDWKNEKTCIYYAFDSVNVLRKRTPIKNRKTEVMPTTAWLALWLVGGGLTGSASDWWWSRVQILNLQQWKTPRNARATVCIKEKKSQYRRGKQTKSFINPGEKWTCHLIFPHGTRSLDWPAKRIPGFS